MPPIELSDELKNFHKLYAQKTGPKPIFISASEVQFMAMIMCPVSEIAEFFGMSERQFYRRVAVESNLKEAFVRGRAMGKRSLRRKQYEVAIDGDVSMLKWLGQNVLGQSSHHTSVVENLRPIEMDDAIDAEFEEVLNTIDEKLSRDGYFVEHGNPNSTEPLSTEDK